MFCSRMVSKVRKELENIGCFFYCEINFLKVKDDVMFFEVNDKEDTYLIRYYEGGGVNYLIQKYTLLKNLGIKTEEIVTFSDNVVVCCNMQEKFGYKLLKKEDLYNEDQIRKLAKWCKKFNAMENDCYLEVESVFILKNIKMIIEKFNLHHNKVMNYVVENFNNIKMKYDKLNKSIILGDFFIDSVLFCEEACDFCVCGISDVFIVSRYEFMCVFLEIINEKYKSVFIDEFKEVTQEEQIIGEFIGCITGLYLCGKYNIMSHKAKKYLDLICDKKMLEMARAIVEWY